MSYSSLDFDSIYTIESVFDDDPSVNNKILESGLFPGTISTLEPVGILVALDQASLYIFTKVTNDFSYTLTKTIAFDPKKKAADVIVINDKAVVVGILDPNIQTNDTNLQNQTGLYMEVFSLIINTIPILDVVTSVQGFSFITSTNVFFQDRILAPSKQILRAVQDCGSYFYVSSSTIDHSSIFLAQYSGRTYRRVRSKVISNIGFRVSSIMCVPDVIHNSEPINGLMFLLQSIAYQSNQFILFVDYNLTVYDKFQEHSDPFLTTSITYIQKNSFLRVMSANNTNFNTNVEPIQKLLSIFIPETLTPTPPCLDCNTSKDLSLGLKIFLGVFIPVAVILILFAFFVRRMLRQSEMEVEMGVNYNPEMHASPGCCGSYNRKPKNFIVSNTNLNDISTKTLVDNRKRVRATAPLRRIDTPCPMNEQGVNPNNSLNRHRSNNRPTTPISVIGKEIEYRASISPKFSYLDGSLRKEETEFFSARSQ